MGSEMLGSRFGVEIRIGFGFAGFRSSYSFCRGRVAAKLLIIAGLLSDDQGMGRRTAQSCNTLIPKKLLSLLFV